MRIFFYFLIIFLTGCSTKINLTDYRPVYAPKNENAPKNLNAEIKKISLVKFPKYYYRSLYLNEIATNNLLNSLENLKFVKVLRVIDKTEIKDEIKAAEISKETDDNIGADYLLKGKIISSTYTPHYHKGYYYYVKQKDKKIRKYSPPYYSYTACTQISLDIYTLPEFIIKNSLIAKGCSYYSDSSSISYYYPELIINSVKKTIENLTASLKTFFAPKGYIYEIRTDGDDLIAKITLGKNQGMREDTKLNVYRLKKDKITNKVEKIKIGEAKVSNLIFDNSCWVVLDLDDNIKPQIGDMVIPSFNYSFWDLFK